MSEIKYFLKFSYLTLKEDILCQKEDGRTWAEKEDMSSQRRTYGNPRLLWWIKISLYSKVEKYAVF
jgi:hypothetical protein